MAAGKKLRKPYTITRPREKWTADEHDRFLHALLLFGRDWKRIEQLVVTKTATQIRSHAQKYFLKAQKLGLAMALPPPHPRRAPVLPRPPSYQDNAAAGMPPPQWSSSAAPPPMNSIGCTVPSGVQQSADWACASAGARWPGCNGEPSEAWIADAMFQDEDETIQLPLSPDDLRFAQVYRFVGDVFGSGAPRPVEAQLQRLQEGMDPVVVEAILLVLRNLEDNICA
ncbi:protein REVEILLE 6-like [Phragmites australis]|uniref:protein REVEILLE 6-like n=1 Tax=Phragmites australis TaxID=29695 RepID=UPI002D780561|nr:protein REVEILLE 6-like [Phragmites australis]